MVSVTSSQGFLVRSIFAFQRWSGTFSGHRVEWNASCKQFRFDSWKDVCGTWSDVIFCELGILWWPLKRKWYGVLCIDLLAWQSHYYVSHSQNEPFSMIRRNVIKSYFYYVLLFVSDITQTRAEDVFTKQTTRRPPENAIFVPGDLDLWPWHSYSSERGTKHVVRVNLVQIRVAVPEIGLCHT